MRSGDFATFTLAAIRAHRTRSLLTVTGIGIGVAAVVLLTAIGEHADLTPERIEALLRAAA